MRILSLSVLFLILYSVTFSQTNELVLERRKSIAKKAMVKSSSGIRFSFAHDKIYYKTRINKSIDSYNEIWLNGSYPNGEVGTPSLPAYKKLIRIPKGSSASVKVISHTEQLIILKDNAIEYPIFPNQLSVSKNQDTTDLKFEINKSAYSKKSYSNAPIATIEVLGNLRSATIARLVVNPIDYNPVDGMLKVYNDIDIDVTFEGALSSDLEQEFDAKTYSPYFDATYKSLDQSSKSSYTDHPDMTKYPVKMLIISDRMFEQALQPFIQWKTIKGFDVKILYTDIIGTSSTLIKSAIQQEYNSATPVSPAPTFLILVGDVDKVTASSTGSQTGKATDLYYASVDGDMFPEMYYGRLSATNTAQLQNIIDKIIYYEKYQFADPTYLNSVNLIAGVDGTWNPNVGQPTMKYGTANYFNLSHGFNIVNEYGVSNDPNNSIETSSYTGCYSPDKISVGFINYTAHGSTTSWENPALDVSSINSFSNTNKYPLAIGNCCLSGDFGTAECLGEAWIRAQNKGAVTYIGSSPNSYWLEDFYWAVGAFPMVGSNNGYVPTFAESTTGAYDAPFVSNYVTTGAMVFAGNLAVTEAKDNGYSNDGSITSKYYWEAYNILGDPSLMPYFTEGEVNQTTYSPTLVIGETSFTVNALSNSYIAISKNNQLIGTAFATNTGDVTVPITPVSSNGDIVIVITRPQTIPIIDTIQAISPAGTYLILDSFSIDDHLTNNNNKADYNETFSTNISIKNIGILDATNVKVKILGVDDNINIEGNDSISISNIPYIEGTNILEVIDAFSFKVNENIPDQHVATFTLKFYSDQGTWSSRLQIVLNSPILSIGEITFDDSQAGGNNDGILNPGETCIAKIQVKNIGHALAKNVVIQVSIPEELQSIASVVNTQTEPFSIEGDSVFTLPFSISVVPDLRSEPIIPLSLLAYVEEPSGISQTFEKNIQVIIKESVNMSNITLNTCFTYFYDSGGKDNNYSDSENLTTTFVAENENKFLKVSFKEFSTESGYDFLYVYDGPNTNSQQFEGSPFAGSEVPRDIFSNGRYITFRFTSDDNTNAKGWKAIIECIEPLIPACVSVLSPADGEQLVQSLILTWHSQAFATYYDVYLGSSVNSLQLSERVYKPVYSFAPKKSQTYYWQVVPGNIVGSNNSGCNIWQFTTDTISRILMSNNILDIDTILFYDSGGPLLGYSNNESDTLTLKPKYSRSSISVSFLEFNLESHDSCSYDYLSIYDGLTTNSPIIGKYCGVNSPGIIKSKNRDGALTFIFKSDNSQTFSGWKAVVTSSGITDIPIITSKHVKFFPNPVTDRLTVNSENPITSLSVFSTLGLCVFSEKISNLSQKVISVGHLQSGVYILIINTENSIPEKALIIKK